LGGKPPWRVSGGIQIDAESVRKQQLRTSDNFGWSCDEMGDAGMRSGIRRNTVRTGRNFTFVPNIPRGVLVTAILLASLSIAVGIEYGYTYASIVVSVILALGIEVWLFLQTLIALRDVRRRRATFAQLRLIALLCIAATLLHAVSPAPLGTVTKYAAVITVTVFMVMMAFGARR